MIVPGSTYRLQLHAGFGFDDAAAIAPALADLGITHLYLSPVLKSAAGSTHGYDGVDPGQIDPERGGRPGFDRLLDTCRSHGLGLVLDIVPNHLCVTSPHNAWWLSVLRRGRHGPGARFFDIDWDAPHAEGRVILPVLGDTLDAVIARAEITTQLDQGVMTLVYHEHGWPLRPGSAASILHAVGTSHGELTDIAARYDAVERAAEAPDGPPEPAEQIEATLTEADERLARLVAANPEVAASVKDRLRHAASPAELDRLIVAQHFKPMHWREAGPLVNYRRFFDIDSLAGVRVEDPCVFEAVHSLIIELAALPGVDGLRVDHPDGLRDPQAYFARLAERTGGVWTLAEKILETDEALPDDWAVAGTTGYDFLNDVSRLLVNPDAETAFNAVYQELTGRPIDFRPLAHDAKRDAATRLLSADLDRLVRLTRRALPNPAEAHDAAAFASILAELAAGMPVYRTYQSERRPDATARERERLDEAAAMVRRVRPDLDAGLLRAISMMLRDPDGNALAAEAVVRFQQFSAPATAKGVEDTAFYRFHRLIALNEVGGDPGLWSLDTYDFHERVAKRAKHWPDAMLAGSTHDTKRSEDVRARLLALAAEPEAWSAAVRRWWVIAQELGADAVDPNDLYLLLQTLVGAWPIGAERATAYMVKAAREAKERTSWRDWNESYEAALGALVEALLGDDAFRQDLEAFVQTVRRPGRIVSLTQTTLRLACPGVPDTYQGCELWDLSLVDPDNRRPVDHALRRDLLARVDSLQPKDIWNSLDDPADPGLSKLWLTTTLLRLRRDHPEVFGGHAPYLPLTATGPDAHRVIAFARAANNAAPAFIAVLPIQPTNTPADWTIDLPQPHNAPAWTNRCTNTRIAAGPTTASQLFAGSPLALLIPEADA